MIPGGGPAEIKLLVKETTIVVRSTNGALLVDLRHKILRAGLPRESAIFSGDDADDSRHYGAFLGDTAVCCASFHLKDWKDQPAWQLRGMATDSGWVSQGLGRAVLSFALSAIIAESPIHFFWCNARLIAVPFYQKLGWKIASEQFEIPTAGPHYRMVRST